VKHGLSLRRQDRDRPRKDWHFADTRAVQFLFEVLNRSIVLF
jgi:hypothetical protein